ncbi:MAG TPA: hypothetical protein VH062_08815 [Polyangiaceae bacterium]|jgi:hypothetical protein|nr:hypothetical protein [Polyangiaceae bacterium]
MTELIRSERFISELREEFPEFRIVRKAGNSFSIAIDRALKVLTLGGQRNYLSHYHTVIGYTLYVPASWDEGTDLERVILLRHERVHMRQRRRYGMVGMAFLYLLPVLPLGLAYGRARIEWEAYEETLRATAEHLGIEVARSPALRAKLIERFTGPDYGWMWPFPKTVGRWIDTAMRDIERGPG